jgi:hypothetical protein
LISDGVFTINENFQKLELTLIELVQSGKLHWRHHKMTIGMLLTMMVFDHKPSEAIINLWLDCLHHDDKIIRERAFQVISSYFSESMNFNKLTLFVSCFKGSAWDFENLPNSKEEGQS